MSEQGFHVVVVGGGLGGLCLAQGLAKAGVSVAVYERDETPGARTQGYRIHIDPQGSAALHECLPERLWEIFDATGGVFGQGFTVLTEQLSELLRLGMDRKMASSLARHRSVSRITLRRVLLAGLEDRVHFGKRFLRYEETPNGRVSVHFEDGGQVEADVLVGADGVNSGVRRQYLPHAEPMDTGVVGIGGKIALSDCVLALAPDRLLDGPVMILPPAPCSLFMALWKRSPEAGESLRGLGIEKPLDGDEDYLIMALGGRPEHLGVTDTASGTVLKDAMRRAAADWHPSVRKLVEMVDEKELFLNRLRSSSAPAAWRPTRVTLLGDAIHSMTPYRGIGGNIALRDAALLSKKLAEARRGERSLLEAIGEYESTMRAYAFAAVADSRKAMEQFTGPKKGVGFAVVKAGMRAMNSVTGLRMRLSA